MWVERLNFGNVSLPDFRDLQDLEMIELASFVIYKISPRVETVEK